MKKNILKKSLLAIAIATALSPANAFYEIELSPMFTTKVWEVGDPSFNFDEDVFESNVPLTDGHITALKHASAYWTDMFINGYTGANKVVFGIVTKDVKDNNAAAGSYVETTINPYLGYTYVGEAIYNPNSFVPSHPSFSNNGIHGFIVIDRTIDYPTLDWNTNPISSLPDNGDQMSLSVTLEHEIAHGLGINTYVGEDDGKFLFDNDAFSLYSKGLHDIYGNAAQPGQEIVDVEHHTPGDGKFVLYNLNKGEAGLYFTGTNVSEVLNGALIAYQSTATDTSYPAVPGIPINAFEEDADGKIDAEFSHLELQNSLMSHQNYRNWSIFMEAELAVLQDIGYEIDRKNYYGYSIYSSGTVSNRLVFINTNPYYARTADKQWIAGKANSTSFGTGMHVYGSYNDVYQKADILSDGTYGIGVRVDGKENHINLMKGTTVQANGYGGIGLLVAYGRNHNVTVNGNVSALGENGTALRFDFGDNILSNKSEYRGSWIRTQESEGLLYKLELPDELKGSLIDDVSLSGNIQGSDNAILIGQNAHVANINFLNNLKLSGDITSKWDPTSIYLLYSGDLSDLVTKLNFGYSSDSDGNVLKTPDSSYSFRYDGAIEGKDSFVLNFVGGYSSINGTVDALSVDVDTGAHLGGNATYTLNDTSIGSSSYGTFTNKGLVTPGNSIGSITIIGNYTQDSSGSLEMEFDSSNNTDKLIINGDAQIDGSLVLSPYADYYNGLDTYSVNLSDLIEVTGASTIEDTFALSPSSKIVSPTLTYSIRTTGSDFSDAAYYFGVSRDALSYEKYARNYNASEIAKALYLGSFAAVGDMRNVYKAIDFSDISGVEVTAALNKLSPSIYGNAYQSSFDYQHFLNNLNYSDSRLNALRLTPENTYLYAKTYAMKSDKGEVPYGYSTAYNYGVIVGADKKTEDSNLVGVYFAANMKNLDSNNSSKLKSTGVYLGAKGLFNVFDDESLHVFTDAHVGLDINDVKRSSLINSYHGEASSDSVSLLGALDVGLSYDIVVGSTKIVPNANLEYTHLYAPSIHESGNGIALNISSGSFDSLKLGAGVDLISEEYTLAKDANYKYLLGVKYNRELLQRAGNFKSSFKYASNTSFDTRVDYLGKDSLDLNGNIEFIVDNGQVLSLNLGSQLYFNHGTNTYAKVDYRWKF